MGASFRQKSRDSLSVHRSQVVPRPQVVGRLRDSERDETKVAGTEEESDKSPESKVAGNEDVGESTHMHSDSMALLATSSDVQVQADGNTFPG